MAQVTPAARCGYLDSARGQGSPVAVRKLLLGWQLPLAKHFWNLSPGYRVQLLDLP